ncbi:MAG: host attachment protein [Paracoccaceae bacterium]|nr:host attachment protein [Paracoccaceae bacterium]
MANKSTWALVCSVSRARILRGLEPTVAPRPNDLALRARQANLRAYVNGRIGGEWPGAGAEPGPLACLRADERIFAAEIAVLLNAHRLAGEFSRLAVISPPAMLALLRDEFPAGLRRVLEFELAMDLLREEEADLLRRVTRLVNGGGS